MRNKAKMMYDKISKLRSEQTKIIQEVHDATNETTDPIHVIEWGRRMREIQFELNVVQDELNEIEKRVN